MKIIKLTDFLKLLDSYLNANSPFELLRNFIYKFFESEERFNIEADLLDILPVLAPYFEYEEAFGDHNRKTRFIRLRQILVCTTKLRERVIFALEFERIMSLQDKLNKGMITKNVYDEQLEKLSPAQFDLHLISAWAKNHNGKSDIDISKIV